MQRKRSLIQSSPRIRRRAKTTLFDGPQTVKPKQKPTLQNIQNQISQNHKTIHRIIDQFFEKILVKRFEKHQEEILRVYKYNMQRLTKQIQTMTKQYQNLLEQNRTSKKMHDLENKLQYFTKQSIVLFDRNKNYELEIKSLKKIINQLKIDNQTKNLTILNLTRKVMKYKKNSLTIDMPSSKTMANTITNISRKKPSTTLHSRDQHHRIDTIINKTYYKTEMTSVDNLNKQRFK